MMSVARVESGSKKIVAGAKMRIVRYDVRER
jgi:hypothetical protein